MCHVEDRAALSRWCRMQMVHRMDAGRFPSDLGVTTYQALWSAIQAAMFQTHVESSLKHDIIREPERYVQLDPDLAQALLDLKQAGKKLLLITNSDWVYTKSLMAYAYDRCALAAVLIQHAVVGCELRAGCAHAGTCRLA